MARRNRSAEPKCCRSARRRAGPTPSSSSKIEANDRVSRRCRWNPTANRCASSLIRCRSWSRASAPRGGSAPAPRDEHLLDPLRQRHHGDTREVERLHRRERGRELALAAIDDHEVRRCGKRLVVVVRGGVREPRKAARHDLRHRSEIVHTDLALHAELPVVGLLGNAVPKHDHRPDVVLSHRRRDVEAFDPDRQRLEVQHLAQLLERLDSAQALELRLLGIGRERVPRVLGSELLQPPLFTTLRCAHLDARSPTL